MKCVFIILYAHHCAVWIIILCLCHTVCSGSEGSFACMCVRASGMLKIMQCCHFTSMILPAWQKRWDVGFLCFVKISTNILLCLSLNAVKVNFHFFRNLNLLNFSQFIFPLCKFAIYRPEVAWSANTQGEHFKESSALFEKFGRVSLFVVEDALASFVK